MKIKEIISEDSEARLTKTGVRLRPEQERAMPFAHRVAGNSDRFYDLNRVMIAAAMGDGKLVPSMPQQSWAGRNNIAIPYTKLESDMLKCAYIAAGVEWDDALKPNEFGLSLEDEAVNKSSPVAKIKPNKYGV